MVSHSPPRLITGFVLDCLLGSFPYVCSAGCTRSGPIHILRGGRLREQHRAARRSEG